MPRIHSLMLYGFIAAMMIFAAPAQAADMLAQGPKVGETIPHQLSATDQNGQQRNFQSLKRKRGLILLFTRSLDW